MKKPTAEKNSQDSFHFSNDKLVSSDLIKEGVCESPSFLRKKEAYYLDQIQKKQIKQLVREKFEESEYYNSEQWLEIMEQLDEEEAYQMRNAEINHR